MSIVFTCLCWCGQRMCRDWRKKKNAQQAPPPVDDIQFAQRDVLDQGDMLEQIEIQRAIDLSR